MSILKTNETGSDLAIGARSDAAAARKRPADDADLRQRSNPEWDEMMLDYAAIEKRAQAMRSEAAWSIAGAVREWAVNLFRRGRAKARAAAQAPLASRVQSS